MTYLWLGGGGAKGAFPGGMRGEVFGGGHR